MNSPTVQQLQCFDAVITEGSYQGAAMRLGRTHPTVFTAIKNLEAQLGVALFDRTTYRASLTEAGHALHTSARSVLAELNGLCDRAARLAAGEETSLTVIVGDLCPLPPTLGLLRRFFESSPATQLDLHFEALGGPAERLSEGSADLILHYVDKTDPNLEFIDVLEVRLIPVVADGFLHFPITDSITPEQMRTYVQCVIRDSARQGPSRSYHLLERARHWTVSDQSMKKELIMQAMGWGHMPSFMVEDELAAGRLKSIAGRYFRGRKVALVAARRRDRARGPVAERLWRYIAEEAPILGVRGPGGRGRGRSRNPAAG
jgi:DNA-binding transcriptional LysR family regulator